LAVIRRADSPKNSIPRVVTRAPNEVLKVVCIDESRWMERGREKMGCKSADETIEEVSEVGQSEGNGPAARAIEIR
jgi:hypothetical protein